MTRGNSDVDQHPIAVIGMACRLPGGVNSPEQLWDALIGGADLVTEIPSDRWDVDEFYDPEPGVPGRSPCKWGGFLDDVSGFDPDFFGISEREATAMDPQHRLLLEASWEAMEHAGLTPTAMAGSLTGVFVGLTVNDYELLAANTDVLEGPYGVTGANFSIASGRIAHALGLHGPAITVDTACSSGLLTVHMACRSLIDGESDLALAGGANVMLDPRRFAGGSAAGMLSPTGRCHAFDVAADGFAPGEGVAIVLLKRLADAQRDGDRILAVLRGTAANQDGRTETITTPSRNAQMAVYRAALARADVDPNTIGMVEAHGPGTPMGDPIEYASLATLYGVQGSCALGSVKSNIGHTQSAAGAFGLMKAVLAVQHGVVPQNLHFNRLPDQMAEIDTNLFVPQTNTPWPTTGQHPRRAAVSSYGMSGTNVHAIVEQAPETMTTHEDAHTPNGSLLFALSSTSADELRQTSGQLANWLESRDSHVALQDLGYTLARRRAHRPVRTAVVASDSEGLITALREVADGDAPYQPAVGRDDRGPVWVFSGQGSQWAAMGAQLLATEPVFAAAVAELEPLIAKEAGFSVADAIAAPETVTAIDQVQPAIFTMQVALAATMKAYGVAPGAVIGHSMGEAAAAVVSGALSMEDGVRVICRRSRLMSKIAGSGAMASVELPAPQVISELMSRGISDVVVAVVASPESTVIGGDTQTVRDLVAEWEQRDVMAREVAVDVASHSPQVDPILDDLTDALAEINPLTPEIPYYSATSFDPREHPVCDAYYWVDNLRHTVRFAAAMQAALEDGFRVFAELSPHPLLTHAVGQNGRSLGIPLAALAAMRREQELPNGLLDFLADLHNAGAAVDFSVLYPAGELVDAPLPTWTRRPLLLSRDARDSRAQGRCTVPAHPLMGAHVRLNEEPERHVWQAEVGTDAHPWLGDHQIHNAAALPGAAYCEMALSAANAVYGNASEVRDITFEQMLLLDEQTPVGAVATLEGREVAKFAVESTDDGEHARHASAVLHAVDDVEAPASRDVVDLLAAHPCRVDGEQIRQWMAKRGLVFGPAFAGLAVAYTAEGSGATVLAEVALPASIRSEQAGYLVHPALLDACFQSVAAHPSVGEVANGGMLLPLGVRHLRAYGPANRARYCYAQVTEAGAAGVEADIDILDEDGHALITVRGLKMGTGVSQASERDRVLGERLLTIEWEQRELPEVADAHPGAWLVISTSATAESNAANLADALKAAGAQCTSMSWSQRADHQRNTQLLREHLATDGFDGVVVLTGPRNGSLDDELAVRGGEYVRHVVRIVRELPEVPGEPRLYLITSDAQTVRDGEQANLEQAGLRGLMRVLGTEHPQLRGTQIDIDDRTGGEQLAQQLLARSDEDETAWRDGQWYVARLTATPLRADERQTADVDYERHGVRLQIRTPGDLESMELVAFERVSPGPGQIEVAVTASSINFADVLIAFGRYPTFEGRLPELGTDFAGVVTAVGPGVTDHKVGDRVGGLSGNGCWSTFVTCDANLAVTLPPGLTEGEAAATTTAHATAWYGLHDLARIRSGDRVLIHSATGGVGQAAIAIARAVGAEIFATAGSEERRQLLRDMGIQHVYDSRSTDFADEIRRDTDGGGVDIVLNSVTGAAQRAGIELLALGGRFVEIGKRDIYGDSKLGLFPFRRNLAFFGVDLALMSVSHPQQVRNLLKKVYRLTAEGSLPKPESTHYPLADAATAIRVIGGAQHTGKLVLDIPRVGQASVVVPPEQAQILRNDGSYIITGGLGGLGLFLAEKMAAAGAGRIVLTSRSQPSDKALETIDLIRAMGADIVVECGDITAPGTAKRLVAAATATGLPLRGVLHAAAVVEDATLQNITDELIERDWAPKVYGAWHLHRATASQPLDWFCSFSSAAALVGSPGQGAYAAANSWLDAFTKWRRAQGLPGTAIAWGAWAEVGRATAVAEAEETAITPEEGAYAFQALLRHDRPYTGYAPLSGSPWFTALAKRSRFAERLQVASQSSTDTSRVLDELNSMPKEEWPTRLRRLVSDQVGVILRRSIDPDRPLSEYGLDSLGNLELRTHIKAETGVRITSADITTIQGLASLLCEKLASSPTAPARS
nr:type I polyketide synthase [Mycobacterium sp. 3519A]